MGFMGTGLGTKVGTSPTIHWFVEPIFSVSLIGTNGAYIYILNWGYICCCSLQGSRGVNCDILADHYSSSWWELLGCLALASGRHS